MKRFLGSAFARLVTLVVCLLWFIFFFVFSVVCGLRKKTKHKTQNKTKQNSNSNNHETNQMGNNATKKALGSPFSLKNGMYQVDVKLGEGNFGITYKARAVLDDKQALVIVKELKDNKFVSTSSSSLFYSTHSILIRYKDLFIKEFNVMLKVKQAHPDLKIPLVYDQFVDHGTYYYVMEFIDGTTVFDLTKPKNFTTKVIDNFCHSFSLFNVDVVLLSGNVRACKANPRHTCGFAFRKGHSQRH